MFRTELNIPPSFQLGLSSKVVTAGSCFSEVIGQKLQQYKVPTLVNPFGTIFNPVSICQLLEMSCTGNYDLEEHMVEHQGIWYHYNFHSSFSSPDQKVLLQQMEEALRQTQEFLRSAQLLILTFGTAIAYQLKDDEAVVANCHKLPESNFGRRLLSYYDMVDGFGSMCAQLKMLNADLKILLTVSPVRHLKETITGNSVSKAHLRVACHQFTENFPDVHYFPSFELMMDDLRDYRFYQDDMIHPTSLAEKYIWQKFTAAYFDRDFHSFVPEWEQIQKALAHHPFHPESASHQTFLRNLLGKLTRISQLVDVSTEMKEVRRRLESAAKTASERPFPHQGSHQAAEEEEPQPQSKPFVPETALAPAAKDKHELRVYPPKKAKRGKGKKEAQKFGKIEQQPEKEAVPVEEKPVIPTERPVREIKVIGQKVSLEPQKTELQPETKTVSGQRKVENTPERPSDETSSPDSKAPQEPEEINAQPEKEAPSIKGQSGNQPATAKKGKAAKPRKVVLKPKKEERQPEAVAPAALDKASTPPARPVKGKRGSAGKEPQEGEAPAGSQAPAAVKKALKPKAVPRKAKKAPAGKADDAGDAAASLPPPTD